MSDGQAAPLSAAEKRKKAELAQLAGLNFRAEALDVILELLATGVAPNSLGTVLHVVCRGPGGVAGARRQVPAAPGAPSDA